MCVLLGPGEETGKSHEAVMSSVMTVTCVSTGPAVLATSVSGHFLLRDWALLKEAEGERCPQSGKI